MSDPFDPFDLTHPPETVPSVTVDAPPHSAAPVARPLVDAEAYLKTLNASQRQAVETIDGPVLVLAGAGTGKTRVLTTRLSHILLQGKARPWQVLAVTFTNKAAKEMRNRVADMLGGDVEGWWIGTFHAIATRILRRHAEAVGLRPDFTILDTDDQIRLVKQFLQAYEVDDKRWPARVVVGIIQRWKDRGLTPDQVPKTDAEEYAEAQILDIYKDYQQRMSILNAADFGDLLLHSLTLFRDNPDILADYQKRFQYLLVDEYQDTNVCQYLWLRLLAQKHHNICCVGDDDQSIYSWRGAEVGNILKFEQDFPGAEVIRLERNYRSTPHILGAASGLIANNQGRLGKTLWTDIDDGEKVVVRGVWDGDEEARYVGDEIESLQAKKQSLNQMAVLVRAGFQTREFEERLITLGIPYRVLGGLRFYERQEIRDAIAYLRVVRQPDDDLAFERVVNLPKRGIGDATLQIVHSFARAEQISLTAAITRLLETDELRPAVRRTLAELMTDFGRWRGLIEHIPHPELAGQVLDEAGYTAMWRQNKTPEAPGRLDNLKELIVAMEDFASLDEFLEHVSLVMDNEQNPDDDKVTLMTLHGAKGLEFETVFLPGWEDGIFPHQRALDDGGSGGIEEERRLAYVGLTRARKRALISFAANRRVYGQWQSALPSRFIDELPPKNIERFETAGLQASNQDGFGHNAGFFPQSMRRPVNRRQRLSNEPVSTTKSGHDDHKKSERIFHQKFGYGTILSIDGDKLDIQFEKAGRKKVMASFVKKP